MEEYSVSHLPEAVQIAPGETPDLDKLRISPDSIGRPHPLGIEATPSFVVCLCCSGVLLLCWVSLQCSGTEDTQRTWTFTDIQLGRGGVPVGV